MHLSQLKANNNYYDYDYNVKNKYDNECKL